MTMLKECIKWEWSLQILWEWCSQCKGWIFKEQKKKPCQTKTLMQPGLQNGHCKTLLSPPQKVSGFPSLPMLARAPQGEQCPFGGWNSLSPCSLWVGDRAVTGRVPRGASGPCFQWPPALEHSFHGLHLFNVLVCVQLSHHWWDCPLQRCWQQITWIGWETCVLVCWTSLFKSLPQMNFVVTIFAPDRAATWQLSKALQMLWAWERTARALQSLEEDSCILWRKAPGFSF